MPLNKREQLKKQIEEFNTSMGVSSEYRQKIARILLKIS
jgi:hypothetical protein